MKVVIAAVSSNRFISGVSRHAANVVRSLLTRSEVSELHVIVAPWEYQHMCDAVSSKDSRLHIHAVSLRPGTLSRNLWYYRDLPAIAKQLQADVVHISYPSPIREGAFHCPTVVTLHDFYPYDIPSNFGFPKVIFNRLILQQCLGAANAISCVSDSTRLRLGIKAPKALPKSVTVYNCVEPATPAVKPSFVEPWCNSAFLLCVAQHRRNKNIVLALKVFNRLLSRGDIDPSTRLLIVGMPGPESALIHKMARQANLTQRVVFASGISDAEMQWCYRNCEVLLAPSIVEGFGLPIAEAMIAGCRIVCSDIPAFRELGRQGCRFIELGPDAEVQFAEAICDSLHERRPLPSHLPYLSASVIAEQYLRLYQLVITAFGISHPAQIPTPASPASRPFSIQAIPVKQPKQRSVART